jgi:hypothetical protein
LCAGNTDETTDETARNAANVVVTGVLKKDQTLQDK